MSDDDHDPYDTEDEVNGGHDPIDSEEEQEHQEEEEVGESEEEGNDSEDEAEQTGVILKTGTKSNLPFADMGSLTFSKSFMTKYELAKVISATAKAYMEDMEVKPAIAAEAERLQLFDNVEIAELHVHKFRKDYPPPVYICRNGYLYDPAMMRTKAELEC